MGLYRGVRPFLVVGNIVIRWRVVATGLLWGYWMGE